MAQKRMFDKTITNNDNFLEMPDSTQNLYFHLSMEADDDGFVDNWKSIMRMTGKKDDDLKLLIAKSFIIPFETGVIVIKHWRINNYLRKDRYRQTKYLKEKSLLTIQENEEYELKNDDGTPMVDQMATQYSIVKNSIVKNSIVECIEDDNTPKDTIFDFIEQNFGRTLNSIEIEQILEWEDNELTRYAIKKAVLNGKYNINYINTILVNYKNNSITTIQQAQEEEERFKNRKNNKVNNPEWFDKQIDKVQDDGEIENLLEEWK